MSNKNSFLSWLTSKLKIKKKVKEEIKKPIESELSLKKKSKESNRLLPSLNDLDKKHKLNNNHALNMHKNVILKNNFFEKFKNSLNKTRKFFTDNISIVFKKKKIDNLLFEELEDKMLLADIGVDTTNYIINNLMKDISYKQLEDSEKVYDLLKKQMYDILHRVDIPLNVTKNIPFIILVVGVNGSGKTTTTVKLAKKYQLTGKSVLLVAADTFRSAGREQLQILANLNDIPIISNSSSSDPASVIFDAIKIGILKKVDIIIIDTAGRLHNNIHLMQELRKITKVIKKIDCFAPHEIMLIIDACNGQNSLKQIKNFHEYLNITGIIITKLDGTAKGGIIFSLANNFSIPIRYIGVGEKVCDLSTFHSKNFINAIFD